MAARRAIYLIILTASFMLYIFHTEYLSWMLFLVVVFVPLLSCLMTLPFLSKYNVNLKWSRDCVRENQRAFLAVYTGQAYPVTAMRVQVKIDNLHYGETVMREVYMRPGQETIPAIYDAGYKCGVIRGEIKKARAQDFLGLFLLPVPCSGISEILVLPPEIPFAGGGLQIKAFEQMEEQDLPDAKMRGSGDREQKDVRDYRKGDTARDIHWKLSARQDKLIVREYEPDGHQVAVVQIKHTDDKDAFRRCVGRFLGLANYLGEQGQPYRLMSGGSLSEVSKTAGDMYQRLRDLLSGKPEAPPDEWERPPEKCHRLLFTVSKDDVLLYADGRLKEVFGSETGENSERRPGNDATA